MSGGAVTSFQLTSPTAGTLPFTIGLAFGKGEIPTAVVTSLTTTQAVVKRRWSDGSVKHAIVSGRAPLLAGVPYTVSVGNGTATNSGSALTSADIQRVAPTATVQCGAFGTVVLASLLASPVRTWISGPEMVECHYRADVGGGTDLSVWFHVRLYADGRTWIRAVVENGYLDNGAGGISSRTARNYVPRVTINGAVVYDNGGGSVTHYYGVRWMAEGWIGGDPAITPRHDGEHLMYTKLVPNYGLAQGVSAATLAGTTVVTSGQDYVHTLAGQPQTYTPFSSGVYESNMGAYGFAQYIGLLPAWDALYIKTGDPRAWRSVHANESHLNSYPICWRSKRTNDIPRPSDFTNWSIFGPNQGGGDAIGTGGALAWEYNHHPSAGYFAYLISGDYWHYETMACQAALCYLVPSSSYGSGVNKVMKRQTRGAAWAIRTVSQFAAIAPESDLGRCPECC